MPAAAQPREPDADLDMEMILNRPYWRLTDKLDVRLGWGSSSTPPVLQ